MSLELHPLHQFEVKTLVPLHFHGIDLSFTNSSLMMVLAVIIGVSGLWFLMRKQSLIPSTGQSVAEAIFGLVRTTARDNIGENYKTYLPFIFAVFVMVFMGNVWGLIPYGFTFTSQLAPVGAFALLGLVVCTCVGIKNHGIKWLHTFLPTGIPVAMAPIVVPIEMISFLAKPFSLTVRLAMNMIVGHILLKILVSFIYPAGIAFGPIPFAVAGLLMVFELGIAFLQAYIYTILTSIYLGEAVNSH